MRLAVLSCLLTMPATFAYTPAFDAEERENISVYELAVKAVVTLNALSHGTPSSGAGVLIDESGMILTSSHVIGDATSAYVSLWDGRKLIASVLGRIGEKSDLALLQVNTETPLPYLKLADSAKVRVGQKVLAIGNPYGFERTLTTGIISRIDKERNRIQTDAAINPGNSGGPLLDTQGYVLGINQSIFNPDGNRSNIGIGFAVPANTARAFLKALAEQEPLPSSVAAISRRPITRYNPTHAPGGYKNVSVILQRVSNTP